MIAVVCCNEAASLIEKHGDELAELITLENGKPLWEAKKEVGTAVSWTEYYAGWTTKLLGDTIPLSLPGQFLNYTTREPFGVVVGITPPNYPLTMPLYKAAPALATGNTIIIKPSEDTSLVALRLGEIITEAGFPDGCSIRYGPWRNGRCGLRQSQRRRQNHLYRQH